MRSLICHSEFIDEIIANRELLEILDQNRNKQIKQHELANRD